MIKLLRCARALTRALPAEQARLPSAALASLESELSEPGSCEQTVGEPGGRFVIEVVASQGLIWRHYWVIDGDLDLFSAPFRYVWPCEWRCELDVMARLAGMSLRERWSGWKREPFTSDSTAHVSVWGKPA